MFASAVERFLEDFMANNATFLQFKAEFELMKTTIQTLESELGDLKTIVVAAAPAITPAITPAVTPAP